MPRRPRTRFAAPERSPGFLLWRVTLAWERRIRSALEPHQLTHVQFVLLASLWWLEEHDEASPTQTQLAAQAGTDLMMTSQVLRKLEARGLVDRLADPSDTRVRRPRLTPEGRELVAHALPDVEAADADYFAPLADRDEMFLDALAALAAGGRQPEPGDDRTSSADDRPLTRRLASRRTRSVTATPEP